MKAVDGIKRILEGLMDEISPELLKELKDVYRKEAKLKFNDLMRTAKAGKFTGHIGSTYGKQERFSRWHKYADVDHEKQAAAGLIPYAPLKWEDLQAHPEVVSLSYKDADRMAALSLERARESFVYKNVAKFTNILGDRDDLVDVKADVAWSRGVFEGTIVVELSDAKIFASVSLKYVIRTIPHVTPYYQYPLLFRKAIIKGKTHLAPTEKELQKLLGRKVVSRQEQLAAEGWCPGSGQPAVPGTYDLRRMSPSGKCPVCLQFESVTSRGIMRKHKTSASREEEAAKKLEAKGYCPMSRRSVPQEIIDKIGPVDPYRDPKAPCPVCGQMVRLDARTEWIQEGAGRPTMMEVKKATYYKHKLRK